MSQDGYNPNEPQEPAPPDFYDGSYPAGDNAAPYGGAPLLVKINAITNIVMSAIDVFWALFLGILAICLATGTMGLHDFNGPERQGPTPGDPPVVVVAVVMGGTAVVSFLAGILKLVGGIKLLRRSRGAWGFGLAGGIVGCLQVWCLYFCVLPMAVGIFTIIIMALENTRRYLHDNPASGAGQSPAQ